MSHAQAGHPRPVENSPGSDRRRSASRVRPDVRRRRSRALRPSRALPSPPAGSPRQPTGPDRPGRPRTAPRSASPARRPELDHLGRPRTRAAQRRRRPPRSRRRPRRPSSPPARRSGATSGSAPAEQPVQRSHRARRHHVERSRRRAAPRPGRARTSTLLQPELAHHLVEERGPAQQRLHQRDPQVRPGDRQHQPGQARARADVGTRSRRGGTSSPSTAQLSRCRSQSRGTSRGPIRPADARRRSPAARRTARPAAARSDANTLRAASGAEGVSRETSLTRSHGRSRGAGPRRSAAAPRPRTPTSARPRPRRRGRPCARTASSGPATPARRTP